MTETGETEGGRCLAMVSEMKMTADSALSALQKTLAKSAKKASSAGRRSATGNGMGNGKRALKAK